MVKVRGGTRPRRPRRSCSRGVKPVPYPICGTMERQEGLGKGSEEQTSHIQRLRLLSLTQLNTPVHKAVHLIDARVMQYIDTVMIFAYFHGLHAE